MDLDASSTTSTASTAGRRVALTPELATLVFLHVNKPEHFNTTCRLFHSIASSTYAVHSWFDRRYWKAEQFYELLLRSNLRQLKYVDVSIPNTQDSMAVDEHLMQSHASSP